MLLSQLLPRPTIQSLSKLDLKLDTRTPVPEIQKLLNDTVLDGGKKLRPALCFLMADLFGLPPSVIAPYARAAEFTHSASLAHDDVIDNASKRRNRATLNAISSNSRAVLAGDLLLARVMVEISALGHVQVIRDLAAVIEDLVNGEWLQLEARGVAQIERRHLEEVARNKTASLMAWCCVTPARLAGKSEATIAACRSFGESVGMAFQMIDDVIDFEATPEKPYAQDLKEGLVNFVIAELLEQNSGQLSFIGTLLGKKDMTTWPGEKRELESARDAVRMRARAKLAAAHEQLSEVISLSGARKTHSLPHAAIALQNILSFIGNRCV